jgi:coproporphyrinogen III oxidase
MIVTTKQWFGGGGDLTPIIPIPEDTKEFHKLLKKACDFHDKKYYPKFKKWCDEYFYLPHRKEIRGVGGIFYDNLATKNWDNDMAFTRDVGTSFKDAYSNIVKRHMNKDWSDEDKYNQLIKRGRYVEFNLIHDRGTKFGLMTNGNTEAILMSLPPLAAWR